MDVELESLVIWGLSNTQEQGLGPQMAEETLLQQIVAILENSFRYVTPTFSFSYHGQNIGWDIYPHCTEGKS